MATKKHETEKQDDGSSVLSDKQDFGGESAKKLKEMGERTEGTKQESSKAER